MYLVGAEEFAPDTENPDPAKTGNARPETVRSAYDALGVDCGVLSPQAASWFGALPRNFLVMQDKPLVRRLTVGGISVAVVFFPPLSVGGTSETETPTRRLLSAVLSAGDDVADADVRIAISPWGFEGEFAVRGALAQRFNVLLGAGPGAALSGEIDPLAPGMVWSRADRDGRSLMVLDIQSLPETGMPWTPLSLQAREVRLTGEIASDPRMAALLGSSSER